MYEAVLNNELSRFPLSTWDHSDSKDTLIKLTRYLVLDKFKWNRNQFCENFCLTIIAKYKLNGGFGKLYQRNIYPYITDCFPEWEIKEWELKKSRVPVNFWDEDNAISACKWLIEEKLKWSLDEVSKNISNTIFRNNNLDGMLRTLKLPITELITKAYPDHDWTYLKERQGYKITSKQANEIRKMYQEGYNQRELSRKYKCNPVTIFNIVHNKTFKNPKN